MQDKIKEKCKKMVNRCALRLMFDRQYINLARKHNKIRNFDTFVNYNNSVSAVYIGGFGNESFDRGR